MNINHAIGKFLSEEDDVSATITTPMFQCDVCGEHTPDAHQLSGYIGNHTFRMHYCKHHEYQEVLDTLKQIPIQHDEWLKLEREMPSTMEHSWAGMGQ